MSTVLATAGAPQLSLKDANGIDLPMVASEAIPAGTQVKVLSSGKIARALATDYPIGITRELSRADGDQVTVLTYAKGRLRALASGNLSAGALVSQTNAAANPLVTFAATADGQFVHGVVIKGANNGLEIEVLQVYPFRTTAA